MGAEVIELPAELSGDLWYVDNLIIITMTNMIIIVPVISFLILIYLLLFFIAYIVDEGLKGSKRLNFLQYGRFKYEKNINADLVIVGNSRASTSIDPAILNERLHKHTYNLGLNGGSIELQHYAFDLYMKNNTVLPHAILICMDLITMDKSYTVKARKWELLPWCNDKSWKEFFKRYPVFSFLEKYLPLWKYRKSKGYIKQGIGEYLNIMHSKYGNGVLDYKDGYICLDDQEPMYKHPPVLAINTDFSLTDCFLQQCIEKNIRVILFYPPVYGLYENSELSLKAIDLITKYAQKHAIPFLDYSLKVECRNPDYFRDSWHLNKKGSAWFSQVLADDLRTLQTNATASLPIV